jgi:hypothetical protein
MPRRPCRITATGTDQFPSSSLTVTATETTLQPNWFPHRPPRDNVHLSAPFFSVSSVVTTCPFFSPQRLLYKRDVETTHRPRRSQPGGTRRDERSVPLVRCPIRTRRHLVETSRADSDATRSPTRPSAEHLGSTAPRPRPRVTRRHGRAACGGRRIYMDSPYVIYQYILATCI